MTTLLEYREWLKRFYSKYTLYVDAGIRFVTGLIVYMVITFSVGYMTRLKNPVVPILLALIGTFLPGNFMVVAAMLLLIVHLGALSLEVTLVMMMLFIVLYLIYYRFTPKFSFVLLLTPIAYMLHIPYVVPLILGLVATPVAAIPMSFGTVLYYLLYYISMYGKNVTNAGSSGNVQTLAYLFASALKDPEMYLFVLTCCIIMIVVYKIRRSTRDHAWTIAIGIGSVAQLIIFLAGEFALDIKVGILGLILGVIVSAIIAMILQFFVFHVDYSRTEYTRFEDDEYYYYVKAVPKVSITKREKKVKRINSRKGITPEEIE